jgi:hypothetical protein
MGTVLVLEAVRQLIVSREVDLNLRATVGLVFEVVKKASQPSVVRALDAIEVHAG